MSETRNNLEKVRPEVWTIDVVKAKYWNVQMGRYHTIQSFLRQSY